jgi:hypothetical protein
MLSGSDGHIPAENCRQLPPNAPPIVNFSPQPCLARTLLTATSLGRGFAGRERRNAMKKIEAIIKPFKLG